MTIDNTMSDGKSDKVASVGYLFGMELISPKELHKATSNTTVICSFFWDRYTMVHVFGQVTWNLKPV